MQIFLVTNKQESHPTEKIKQNKCQIQPIYFRIKILCKIAYNLKLIIAHIKPFREEKGTETLYYT